MMGRTISMMTLRRDPADQTGRRGNFRREQ